VFDTVLCINEWRVRSGFVSDPNPVHTRTGFTNKCFQKFVPKIFKFIFTMDVLKKLLTDFFCKPVAKLDPNPDLLVKIPTRIHQKGPDLTGSARMVVT
jgi:hypothetical protein